ncbi:3-beta-hydroxysterol Delta-24-reductase [Hyphodiscus hymeniophilus]|uniref:Delta(24)-sterol reductase n=1 Tax=Hyphodiscus hymeniophilus TaxID=353542 RepID=A0A9P6VHZ1_9HELO|nr:3-beta-hydroxysterol Delta-24-reductase [Hyphodiscus hymeniophilus]
MQHDETVATISTSVRQFYERKESFRIFHGSTNSTRSKPTKNLVDTSRLRHVLSVDKKKMTCLVEPNVSMDRLVEATLEHGLVPPVVMEFPGITVGGGYSGTSGESSSFKHGFFDQTINWVEMVLANGEIVKLSRTENSDLFHAAAGALGTFGVTTLMELQLQEAKKFVETTYWPVNSMQEAIAKLQKATIDSKWDYLDGIMFSKTEGAIVTGRLANEVSSSTTPIKTFSNPEDEWFYLHVKDVISKSRQPVTEAIPLAEYLFRYDRGGFWVGESAFDYFHWPFNKTTRRQLDDFLHTRMMYTALHASGQSKKYVVQDLALPYSTAEQFVEYTDETFGIYPLWLCPLKQNPLPTMHPHSNESEADGSLKQMLNIGLWGPGPKRYQDFVAKNRDLERKLKELGGMKWLYAHTYYDEGQFWEMFDRKWYDDLRQKYGATSLPSVYEKVRINVETEERKNRSLSEAWKRIWPLAGMYGIWKAIRSKTHLEARNAAWREYGKIKN